MDKLNLTVRNRQAILFDGEIAAVTSKNDKGIFDVLPEHENFISIIKESVIIRRKRKEKQEIKIENGVLRVYKNKVDIFIGV